MKMNTKLTEPEVTAIIADHLNKTLAPNLRENVTNVNATSITIPDECSAHRTELWVEFQVINIGVETIERIPA